MERRGQVTVFIIVAILIAVVGFLIFFFFPDIQSIISGDISASNFIVSCLDREIISGVELLSKQGGYANPEGAILYKGNTIKYLCYTSEYHDPNCVVQNSDIIGNFEDELGMIIEGKTDECVDSLKSEYGKRGYSVTSEGDVSVDVSIVPDRIIVAVNAPVTFSKEGGVQSFTTFSIDTQSKMYFLLMTATSIVSYESTFGDSETLSYIQYYPDLIPLKDNLGDGTTVYTLKDATSDDQFVFASRSLAWPGGYGLHA